MDSYQAIYDAVSNRLGNVNIDRVVQDMIRESWDISYAREAVVENIRGELADLRNCMTSPHVLLRPAISIDRNQWCALYGENLQDGVAGFGDSPALAMEDFDRNWVASLAKHTEASR